MSKQLETVNDDVDESIAAQFSVLGISTAFQLSTHILSMVLLSFEALLHYGTLIT